MKWLIALMLFVLVGCTVEKRLTRQLQKLEHRGCTLTTDTIQFARIDSFPIIVNDTIVWEKTYSLVDTVFAYKQVRVPKTRWQTRIEYRERVKTLQVKGDTEVRVVRAQAEYKTNWWIVLGGFVVGLMLIPAIKGIARIQ